MSNSSRKFPLTGAVLIGTLSAVLTIPSAAWADEDPPPPAPVESDAASNGTTGRDTANGSSIASDPAVAKDYYGERAEETLKEDEAAAKPPPHPLAAGFPDYDVVVCEAGCLGDKGAEIVFMAAHAAPAAVTTSEMVPTASDAAGAPAADSDPSVVCVGGCYDGPVAYSGPAKAASRAWMTTVSSEPSDLAASAKAKGKHKASGGSGDWMKRIDADRGAARDAGPKSGTVALLTDPKPEATTPPSEVVATAKAEPAKTAAAPAADNPASDAATSSAPSVASNPASAVADNPEAAETPAAATASAPTPAPAPATAMAEPKADAPATADKDAVSPPPAAAPDANVVAAAEPVPAPEPPAPASGPAEASPAAASKVETPSIADSSPASPAPAADAPQSEAKVAALEAEPKTPAKSGGGDKVVTVSTDDPAMNAAVNKARQSLDQFWKAFDKPGPGETDFALKVAISDKGGVEHFWLTQVRRDGNKLTGTISNEPLHVKSVKAGQRYTFTEDRISDWLYKRNGKMVGNETMRPLLERMSREEAASYRAMYETP